MAAAQKVRSNSTCALVPTTGRSCSNSSLSFWDRAMAASATADFSSASADFSARSALNTFAPVACEQAICSQCHAIARDAASSSSFFCSSGTWERGGGK